MLSISPLKECIPNAFSSIPNRQGAVIKITLTVNLWHLSLLFFSIFNDYVIRKILSKNEKTSHFYVKNIVCLSLNFSLLQSLVFFTGASISQRDIFLICLPILLKTARSFYLRNCPVPAPRSTAQQLLDEGHIRSDGEFARKLKEGMAKAGVPYVPQASAK